MIAKRLVKKVSAVMCLGVSFFGMIFMMSCSKTEKQENHYENKSVIANEDNVCNNYESNQNLYVRKCEKRFEK